MQSQQLAGYRVDPYQKFTPEQMNLFQNLVGKVGKGSFLDRLAGGDEALMQQMEQRGLRDFGALQGNIASRFSGMGSGARRSSAHQLAQTSAASQFAENLQSQRIQQQQAALNDLMSISQMLLGQQPYGQQFIDPEDEDNWIYQLLAGLLPLGGAALGGYFGGVPGAKVGGMVGGAASKAFL